MVEHAGAVWNVRRTVVTTLIVVAVAVGGLLLIAWRDVIMLLFAGIVVATALQPACDFLASRFGLRASIAAAIVYSSLSLTLLGLAIWLMPQLWEQGLAFWEQLPNWYSTAREWLVASSPRTLQRLGEWLPEGMPEVSFASLQVSSGSEASSSTWQLLRSATWIALGVLAMGMLAFYWTINREVTVQSLLHLLPEHRRGFYSGLVETLFQKLGAYVRGQLILCGMVGLLSLLAYWLIGLPYALVLALVAGLLEAIPVFGPTLGAVPAIVVGLSVSPQTAFWVVAAAMVIQTLENYLLVPKVMDRSVGISAVVTLLALVAFGALFGLLGAVLAIPLAAIVQTLFERLVLQTDFKEQEVEVTRDLTGVMRYQLLDLIQDVKRQQRNKEADAEHSTTTAFNEIEALATALDELIQNDAVDEAIVPSRSILAGAP